MAYLNSLILDSGLSYLTANGNRLDICTTEPTNYVQATATFSLGNKAGLTLPAPAAMPSPVGRRVTVPAIADGAVTTSSTGAADDAEFWAITDTVNSVLLAAGPLSAPDLVTAGDGFTLGSFDIGIPFPA